MNEIKTLTAIVAMTAAFSVNAGYRIQIPLEQSGGGNLPNGSIVFTGEIEIEPVDKAKECDDNISNALNYLSVNYPDVNYISGGFGNVFIPRVGLIESCSVRLSIPRSKSSACVGNTEYAEGIGLAAFGVNSTQFEYYGVCN